MQPEVSSVAELSLWKYLVYKPFWRKRKDELAFFQSVDSNEVSFEHGEYHVHG